MIEGILSRFLLLSKRDAPAEEVCTVDEVKIQLFGNNIKSYQKKLNLTKLESYISDLKRKEAYTTYSNPRGFIYQNKDKQNRVDVQASTTVVPLTLIAPTLSPPTIPTISQFIRAVSSIPMIVERYMDQRMNEAVKVAVQIQSDRLRDEAQAENEEFLNNLDENIQKIIKEQVKEQVKTSYVVAADLSEMELKNILIEKMESFKSIHRSDEQRNLYKALADAYECDKIILDIYGDTVTLKRRRDDANKDEVPSAGSDRGSKRRREGKEPESTSAPKEKATKTNGKSTEGSKSHQKTASESTPAEEAMQTTQDLEEPSHQEFETGDADDQPIVEASQHPEWFQKQNKPPTPNRAWNKTLPATHESIQPYRKYTTSVTKTKASDYGHVKWIEDLGHKRQQFYGFAVNRESPRDVYSKRKIIAVTELQIIEWLNYKHLDWIIVRRDDDKKADKSHGQRTLCFQRLSKNVHKKHRHPTACGRSLTSDGTLNDVRTVLDDRLKGIRMKYLPQAIWGRSDKERAAAMIQAIDKQLKTRRIMRSLEKFVGGRLYEEDFKMLQRTI
nr:hypothetical protein [Tanacetum cinerariifolium]